MKNLSPEKILVLDECFRQRVALPRRQVEGLKAEELKTALAFELEPFAGVAAANAAVAYKPLTAENLDECAFDVVVISRAELTSRLAHTRYRAVTSRPHEGEDLTTLPLIMAQSNMPFKVLYGIICLVLLVIIGIDYTALSSQNQRLAKQVKTQRVLAAQLDSITRETESYNAQARQLREEAAAQQRAQHNAAAKRAALRDLMECVAAAYGDDAVVRNITQLDKPFALRITGTTLNSTDAARVCARLADSLGKRGWLVVPGNVERKSKGTITFVCDVIFDPNGTFN